ncbi:hypothetical protein BG74_01095 [Sodalis-like endosymbiont of Proechinophthirus fluctus]|nr:hypothetical protein BG74_07075 [Sodalis-like endosymbiont of Proechinophthirus fluctus]KYP96955.1 hypothetical protein BG74_06665 [Sodalis-like endosymbiont of Proechinophthirus fluctus]KYP97714.1 hypothetical protein BG74_01095 [Sodalis-like endosymbiont of Proechinophthirus fluctus]
MILPMPLLMAKITAPNKIPSIMHSVFVAIALFSQTDLASLKTARLDAGCHKGIFCKTLKRLVIHRGLEDCG